MAEKDKGESAFNVRTAVVLLTVIGGAYLIRPALQSARPNEKETLERTSLGDQVVPARLWQDPFEVALAYRKNHHDKIRPKSSKASAADAATSAQEPKATNDTLFTFREIADQIARQSLATKAPRVTVLEVMMSGGSYAEDAERRHRSRYAVLSALGTAGYVPWDSEHIGYTDVDWPRGKELENIPANRIKPLRYTQAHEGSSLIVPFEWFTPDPLVKYSVKGAVLVLWLNDTAFADHPAKRLAQLNDHLKHEIENSERSTEGKPINGNIVAFKLIDAELHAILGEDLVTTSEFPSSSNLISVSNALKGLEFYSSWSTTADAVLETEGRALPRAHIEYQLREKGWANLKFHNVTSTDDKLAEALIAELRLRGVNVTNGTDAVALVSEWDTFYGRALPLTFAAKVRSLSTGLEFENCVLELKTNSAAWPRNIFRFSYLRGIDGKLAGDSASESGTEKQEDKEKKQTDAQREDGTPRPEGHSQLDYLPRLADRIDLLEHRLEAKGQFEFKAIGILGSDVYDKLLVLQALRRHFSDELYFTTDLDARLLDSRQTEWSRNLIVASSFGLRLRQDLQRQIPPFRDTYQTGEYLACLGALEYTNVASIHFEPRIFEIGQRGAYDLSPEDPSKIHTRARRPFGQDLQLIWFEIVLWVGALVAGGFLCWLVSARTRAFLKCLNRNMVVAICSLTLLLAGLSTAILIDHYRQNGEPFSLTDGISIWPTELLRGVASCLAVFFLYKGIHDLNKSRDRLAEELNLHATAGAGPDESRSVENEKQVSLLEWDTTGTDASKKQICKTYERLGQTKCRFSRLFLPATVYIAFSLSIHFLFDSPFRPYRGWLSSACDWTMVLTVNILQIILVFFVVDASRLCQKLIENLSASSSHWPSQVSERCAKEAGLDPEALEEYFDIQFFAERTETVGQLIFYPFATLFLIIVARSNVFDRWDWPPSIILILGLNSLYAVYGVLCLRRAAEKARKRALLNLNKKLVRALSTPSSGLADKFRVLIKEVESCERGAFAPVSQQPVIKAVLLPFGGAGIVALFNYLPKIFGS
jgi:hypothetical protein